MSRSRLCLAFVLGLFTLAGCAGDDPESPEYWVKTLKSTRRAEAIKMLGRMGSGEGEKAKKAREAIPRLVQLYESDKDRVEIIPALISMKASGPEVVKIMTTALTDSEEQASAAVAATYLGEIGAKGQVKKLLAVLDTNMDDEVKASSLEALATFKDASAVDDLIRILERRVDQQWIHLHAMACRALGEIGPPAANKALPALVRGIFLRDKFQRMAFRECAIALLKFGDEAGRALTAAVDGSDKATHAWSEKQGHVLGLIVEEAAKVLGLLRYGDAVPALAKELVVRSAPPPNYDPKKAQIWAIIEAQRFQNTVEALGRIGDARAVKALSKWLFEGEYLRRVRVPFAINFIGDPSGVPHLVRCAQRAVVDSIGWFRIDCADYLGRLASPADVPTLKRLLPGLEKFRKELNDYKQSDPRTAGDFLRKLDGFALQVRSLEECGESAMCWAGKLENKSSIIKDQAVWQLSRRTQANPKALDSLLSRVGGDDFGLRNSVLDVLPRVCDARCVDSIRAVQAQEKGKARYRGFRDRMEFVITQLMSRSAGKN